MSEIADSAAMLPSSSAVTRGFRGTRMLLPAAAIAAALAVIGFWPTYFGPLLAGDIETLRVGPLARPASLMIHVHSASMVTWLAFFIAQTWLAASGRVRLHVKLGPWVMGYAVLVVVIGVFAMSEGFAARLAAGEVVIAQRWLFGVLRDFVFLVPFLAAGWLYRRQPEIHKRMMLVVTTLLIGPAIGRMVFLGAPLPVWKFMLVWPVPVYLAMIHDFRGRRIVHPAYVIALVAMLTMRLVLPLNTSAVWQTMASHITALYQTP